MWRFLFIKLFHAEIVAMDNNFNKLADEHDKLKQQFIILEQRFRSNYSTLLDDIMLLGTKVQRLMDDSRKQDC